MKKDFASKNLFWLLLAGGVCLILLSLVFLMVVVPGRIAEAEKKGTEKLGAVTKVADVKGPAHVELARKEAAAEKQKETTVHEASWKLQRHLGSFPKPIEDEFDFLNGRVALEVAVQKEVPAEIPENTTDKFHGTLLKFHPEWIDVERRDPKDPKAAVVRQRFYRSPESKMSGGGGGGGGGDDKEKPAEPAVPAGTDFGSLRDYENSYVIVTHRPRYFGDKLTDVEMERFAKVYKDQLSEVLAEAGPLNAMVPPQPVVIFKGWKYEKGQLPPTAGGLAAGGGDRGGGFGFPMPTPGMPPEGQTASSSFFRYVPQWKLNEHPDISTEAWLAQEDVWVQREIFRLVKKANDFVADFRHLGGDGVKQWARFQNPYWDMWLILNGDKNKVRVTIRNRLERLQRLDAGFRVRFTPKEEPRLLDRFDSPPLWPTMPQEPLGPEPPKDIKGLKHYHSQELDVRGYPPEGVFAVRQELTYETAAVKRIDVVSIGSAGANLSLSHRTSLRQLSSLNKEDDKQEEQPKDPMGEGKGPMPIDRGGAGALGGAVKISPHGLIKNRYLEVTPQARRIPVAVSLIVDQMHVARVQTAFADSALRFLTQQVLLHRYPQPVVPPEATPTGVAGEQGPAKGPFYNPYLPRGKGGATMPGTAPGMDTGGTGMGMDPGATAVSEDPQANVELVIYGVVSIYERYPPRGDAPAAEQPKQ